MIGTKIYKPLQEDFLIDKNGDQVQNSAPNTFSKYSECAQWCNENHALIEDIGDYYEVIPIPELTREELAFQTRSKRDYLLEETDYLLAPDYPISPEDLALVKTYRQELRDVPQQEGFPSKVIWPKKPNIKTC